MALPSLNAITENDSMVAAKAVTWKRLRVGEETAAALLSSWTLEKIEIVCKCD